MKNKLFLIVLSFCGVALSYGQSPKIELNFGDIAHKSSRDTVLHVTALDGPMWVDQVKISCTCVKVKYSKTVVMAGEVVPLKITFTGDDKGVFYKVLKVLCSDERLNHDIIVRGRVR